MNCFPLHFFFACHAYPIILRVQFLCAFHAASRSVYANHFHHPPSESIIFFVHAFFISYPVAKFLCSPTDIYAIGEKKEPVNRLAHEMRRSERAPKKLLQRTHFHLLAGRKNVCQFVLGARLRIRWFDGCAKLRRPVRAAHKGKMMVSKPRQPWISCGESEQWNTRHSQNAN